MAVFSRVFYPQGKGNRYRSPVSGRFSPFSGPAGHFHRCSPALPVAGRTFPPAGCRTLLFFLRSITNRPAMATINKENGSSWTRDANGRVKTGCVPGGRARLRGGRDGNHRGLYRCRDIRSSRFYWVTGTGREWRCGNAGVIFRRIHEGECIEDILAGFKDGLGLPPTMME